MPPTINKTKDNYYIKSECAPYTLSDSHKCNNSSECPAYYPFNPKYCAKCQCFYCTCGNCIKRNKQ